MGKKMVLCYIKIEDFKMKIAVLISGGVDSSVALMRLVEQGHEVTAFYLKIWLEDELSYLGTCPWQEDLSYVKAVCEQAAVPLEIVSLQQAYWDEVVAYTIDEVKKGRTPNPDIMCNQRVKFGAFLKRYGDQFDKVATGHYAQIVEDGDQVLLKMSPDPIKDQTYFLSQLSQEQLKKALFPIGDLTKEQVRKLAAHYNLANKDRKDSQGICFLGKIKFADFIRYHVGEQVGPLIECETGKQVGEHKGFWFYTVGQRQGIRLSGGPWYVVAKDPQKNIVFISKSYYEFDKKRDIVPVTHIKWIGEKPIHDQFAIKLRHGPEMVMGKLTSNGDSGIIRLSRNDQGIAPGQFAVFYEGDLCRGSAVISEYKGCNEICVP